jgi:hypothetical protein
MLSVYFHFRLRHTRARVYPLSISLAVNLKVCERRGSSSTGCGMRRFLRLSHIIKLKAVSDASVPPPPRVFAPPIAAGWYTLGERKKQEHWAIVVFEFKVTKTYRTNSLGRNNDPREIALWPQILFASTEIKLKVRNELFLYLFYPSN